MIFLLKRSNMAFAGMYANLKLMNKYIERSGLNKNDFYILTEVTMNYVSKIVFVDGSCIYNNKNFWTSDLTDIINNYPLHTVTDSMGNPVTKEKFLTEMHENISRITSVTGDDEQVMYNMTVAHEFISIVRTEFKNSHLNNYTAFNFASDLSVIESLVMDGAFKEGSAALGQITESEFMTADRISKYQAMLTAADIITYHPYSK